MGGNWQPSILYPEKIYFKNENKIDFLRHTKSERICHQQTCTLRNVKVSPSGPMKMIPNENVNRHNGRKNTENGNYMSKYVTTMYVVWGL